MLNAAATARATRALFSILTVPLLGAIVVILLPAAAGAGNGDTPKPPANVTLTAASPSSLSISWDAPRARAGRDVTGYELFVDAASAATTAGLSHDFASLECARVYTLGIEAIDSAGARSSRVSISASTAACEQVAVPEPTVTATPTVTSTPTSTSTSTAQAHSFAPVADARVQQAYPTTNYGTSKYLRVDAGGDPGVESYLRFEVSGLPASASAAKLRIYATSSGAARPVVFATSSGWEERGVTWNDRPARSGAGSDETGRTSSGTWVEWDVSEHVAGNGIVSFMLVGLSSDGVNMSSREGEAAPQLVVTSGTASTDKTAPTAPTGVAAVAVNDTNASLAWTASTDDVGVAGYNIYRDEQKLGATTGNTFSAGGLVCATTYSFGVEAFDAAGNVSPLSRISVLTAACPPAGSVTCHKYAAPSGSDTAAGTLEAPFRTPQKLASSLATRETGCLRSGSYSVSSGYVLEVSKSETTLRSYPGERAKLVGNIQVRNSAAGTRLSHLDIEGIGGSNSLKVYAPDVIVENNDITNVGRGRSCMILGSNSGYGQAARIVVRRNRFHECGSAAYDNKDHGIYAQNVIDGEITHNVFWNSAAYAIQLYPNAQRTRFAHNVVDGDSPSVRGGVLFGGDSSYKSNDNVVEYNVIAFAVTHNVTSTWSGLTPGTGNVARFNCVWGGALGDINLSKGGFTALQNAVADPQFIDRSQRDYRLGPTSLCAALVGTAGT